ncbi:hypothetical protein [Aliiroseovarius lamellibrachiae]|uniref:hypothetical protein n=1 Tax=Aliiroseovarius lamellibrachiae TaxID=1924933 RepID=UPI001BE002F8|nr:hypothetical protein [Aliiroseovarius lamellibrachiae]MBT2131189.1 hypothetical protein [Aliiroseovarius lamellibrachiae]
MKRLIPVLLIFATPSFASEWNTRSDDQLLTQTELETTLRGQTLTYYDGGTSEFRGDGQYFYTYGGVWQGIYHLGADSTVCVTYVTEQTRCDLYVSYDGNLTVITETGLRFPIKSIVKN